MASRVLNIVETTGIEVNYAVTDSSTAICFGNSSTELDEKSSDAGKRQTVGSSVADSYKKFNFI